ncbi:MAG: hypothetical protein ACLFQB_01950 [Chitinispirillaceae bacterium]
MVRKALPISFSVSLLLLPAEGSQTYMNRTLLVTTLKYGLNLRRKRNAIKATIEWFNSKN